MTERSTRALVAASVGDTVQSVAQSLDAADSINRELVQHTMKGFQRYFEAAMHLDEATGELRSYGALVNEDYGSVDKFATETGGIATVFARKGDELQVRLSNPCGKAGDAAKGSHMALDNIRERLTLYYDLEARLEAGEAVLPDGTREYRVHIFLPCRSSIQ